jgi:formylglycine-generating enzyme required for sulfatase activity
VAKPAEPPPVPRPAIVAAPAATVPGTVAREGPDYPEMVLIPAGDFVRGVPDEEEEREAVPKMYRGRSVPLRRVTIAAPFWLGRCPVTRGEFAAFVNDTGYQMPDKAWTFEPNDNGVWEYKERPGRHWRNPGYEQTDRHPVVCVSHADAAAYAEWLSRRTAQQYRLPSEAEWEYAARSGTRTARYWGDGREQACRYANVADRSLMARMQATFDADRFFDGDDGFPFTAPVGSFLPNAFGLHDMLGNVWEWTADTWHDTYNGAPDDGSAWTTGGSDARRVLRGGSWSDDPGDLRAGVRNRIEPGIRGNYAGFRLARTSF